MANPTPAQRALIERLARFRKEAERGEAAAIKQLADAYKKIHQRLQAELELEVRRIFEKPESIVTRQYITRRISALTEQVEAQLTTYQTYLGTVIDTSTDAALLQGSKHAQELMKLATGGQRSLLSVAFDKLNPEQVNSIVGFLSPGSPLFERIGQIAQYHAPIIRDQLVEAVALGYNPYKTAGNIAPLLKDVAERFQIAMARPFADAVRMARTAQLWSYREAARANYRANDDVVTGWQWYANLDATTCMSCVAQHGTIHPIDEPLDDHYHGRCTPIPVVLSQPLVAENAGRDWFDGLDPAQQQTMMGPGAFAAWNDGKFDLADMSHQTPDDVYGLMRTVKPLKDLVSE